MLFSFLRSVLFGFALLLMMSDQKPRLHDGPFLSRTLLPRSLHPHTFLSRPALVTGPDRHQRTASYIALLTVDGES